MALIPRPSAFQAGHIPSWRGLCECYALSPIAAVSGWLLLLLSSLLSAAGLVPHLRGFPGAVTTPCPVPGPSLKPDCCRTVRQTSSVQVGGADHEVTPQAPWTGTGCREYSYGGFGGGHPRFHPRPFPPSATRGSRGGLTHAVSRPSPSVPCPSVPCPSVPCPSVPSAWLGASPSPRYTEIQRHPGGIAARVAAPVPMAASPTASAAQTA